MTTTTMLRKKNIYFSRHGERIDFIDAEWWKTAKRRFDPPLSPHGLEQAHELGLYIAPIQPRITHIYVSPFLRTIQTALEVVKEINKNISSPNEMTKIRIEPGYGEYYFGDSSWNEESVYLPLNQLSEICEQYREYFDQDYESLIQADYYLQLKVETRQQLRERLKRVLEHTLNIHTNDCNILIITHAATVIEGVRALLTVVENRNEEMINQEEIEIKTKQSTWDMTPIRAGVCSLSHLEFTDNKWALSKNGLISHLSKGEQNLWYFPDDESLYKTS